MKTGPRPSDRFIPWYIVLFFVVQAVAFAWFYHVATRSFTGLVTEEAYEKGLRYNAVIAQAERQEQLGWTVRMEKAGGGVLISLNDREGKPLSGARVRLWLVRPVQSGMDQRLEMTETAPGTYFTAVSVPERGLWEARAHVEKDGHSYQASRRMEF